MVWIILAAGIVIFTIGLYSMANMYKKIEAQSFYWGNGLYIGLKAGTILGLGLGLLIAAILIFSSTII